jgi:polygalacturonase
VVTIRPKHRRSNTDGINIAGTRMHIYDCTVRNGDDCVPLNAPSRDVLVERLHCECGNGLVPIIWEGTSAGDPWDIRTHGGNITNATFRDTTLSHTKLGITIKSLPMMTGTVQGITFENIAVDQVGTAILIDTMNQNSGGGAQ